MCIVFCINLRTIIFCKCIGKEDISRIIEGSESIIPVHLHQFQQSMNGQFFCTLTRNLSGMPENKYL